MTRYFTYKTLEELARERDRLSLDLPLSSDLDCLAEPVRVDGYTLPNTLVIQPLEGCDSTPGGSPGPKTIRRYHRFARGGAGLIWFEAAAVTGSGRGNPRQLWLRLDNLPAFADLVSGVRREAAAARGEAHRPLCILQLTHAGRYSRPAPAGGPVFAFHDPLLDEGSRIEAGMTPVTDAALDHLLERYGHAAKLAQEAGFDGVDIKACHRYLVSELLAARGRPGRYGGGLPGRMRFLLQAVEQIRKETGPGFVIASRISAYDGLPLPWGWGADREDPRRIDLAEPAALARELYARGVTLLNVSAGNPYFNPFLTRPSEWALPGVPPPPEHPLQGVARLLNLAARLQRAVPQAVVVGSGFSWLRQFFPQVAAGSLAAGRFRLVGAGRLALAYPDFAGDLLTGGCIDSARVCITCGKCSQIMREGGMSGCVIRDQELYGPIYRAGKKKESPEPFLRARGGPGRVHQQAGRPVSR